LRVIAVDRTAAQAQWARDNCATDYLSVSDTPDLPQAVRDLTAGLGADRVIDVVGLESTMLAGLNALRRGGRMVVVGYTPESCPLPGKQLAQNELEVAGTRAGRRQDLQRCVQLVAQGKVKSIVRYQYPLEEVNQALDHLRSGTAAGRIVLTYH